MLSLGLSAAPINWVPGVCLDASGVNVQCSVAPAIGEAWSSPCDPDASHAAGSCVSANGTPQTQTPGVISVQSLATGSVLTAASVPVVAPVTATLATSPWASYGWLAVAGIIGVAFFMSKKGAA